MSKIYDKYLELKQEDNNKMYLFKSGKFYIFIADDCDKINYYTPLKKVKFTNECFKCGFPENVLDDYLRVFHNLNLNIEIIEDFTLNNKDNLADYLISLDMDNLKPIDAIVILNDLREKAINEKRS